MTGPSIITITDRLGGSVVEVRKLFEDNALPDYNGGMGTVSYDGALATLLNLRVGDRESQDALRDYFAPRKGRDDCSFSSFIKLYASATGLDGPEVPGSEGGLWLEQPAKVLGGGLGRESAHWAPLRPADVAALEAVFREVVGPTGSTLCAWANWRRRWPRRRSRSPTAARRAG